MAIQMQKVTRPPMRRECALEGLESPFVFFTSFSTCEAKPLVENNTNQGLADGDVEVANGDGSRVAVQDVLGHGQSAIGKQVAGR